MAFDSSFQSDRVGQLLNAIQGKTETFSNNPWAQNANPVDSRFFHYIDLDEVAPNWDKMFPYRLLVVNMTAKGGPAIVNGNRLGDSGTKILFSNDGSVISFQPTNVSWVFTLPITPQQLSISDAYAITTTATLRGVSEEHSGARFKMISASGTMGVWPYRESVSKPPTSPSIIQSLFGGTIEAIGSVVDQVNRVINTATSNHPAGKPQTVRPPASSFGDKSTGFYQAMQLQQFLEQYAEAKRSPANAGWRLVLDIPKQNQSFVVSPQRFIWQQSESKPMHVLYSMQFKAWRRIDLKQSTLAKTSSVPTISPGILQRVLAVISEARKTLSASYNLLSAVRSDVEAPLTALRQTALFVKGLAGLAATAADLPNQVIADYASAISDTLNIQSSTVAQTSTSDSVRSNVAAISAAKSNTEGLSLKAVASGQLGRAATNAASIDPAYNVFKTPQKNFETFDQVSVHQLNLNSAQQAKLDSLIDQAAELSVSDIKTNRNTVLQLALQLSNSFGAGDAFFSKVYGLPAPTKRIQKMTLDEYQILDSLYQAIQGFDLLTATTEVDDKKKQSNMEYVAGLADTSGIDFSVPNSKVLAPVPFGLTIEEISLRYLGDPNRWIEIATLNNLRTPYIDEDGFQIPLLSNAVGRQITIGEIENLYLGQKIVLQSSTQSASARRILDIKTLSANSFLITLDGLPDLDNFLLSDGAYLQAYLPGTVNSQQKIFVPSDLPVSQEFRIIQPTVAAQDPLSGVSKVDLLLTDDGDLAVNNFGDFRMSYGMTNIVQALKIKIGTQLGKWVLHPEFGLGLTPGVINSDVNVQDIFAALNKLITQDPRFAGLSSLQIQLNGPTMTVNMAVRIANQTGVFPVSFQLAA